MRRLITIVALILFPLPLYAAQATIHQTGITIGPGTYSYSEIAQQLSVNGRTVFCASGLKDRAAYVYLKNRDWQGLADALSHGLDVRLVQMPDGKQSYRMEAYPDSVRREARWQAQFTLNLQAALEGKCQSWLQSGSEWINLPYDQALAQYKDVNSKAEDMIHHTELYQGSGQKAFWAVITTRQNMAQYIQPTNWLAAHMPQSDWTGTFGLAISHGWYLIPMDVSSLYPQMLAALQDQADGKPIEAQDSASTTSAIPPDLALYFGFRFKPEDCFASLFYVIIGADEANSHDIFWWRPDTADLADAVFNGEQSTDGGKSTTTPSSEPPRFGSLGLDATAWLNNERSSTHDFLSSDLGKETFQYKAPPLGHVDLPITSVSQIIALWSKDNDQEAICELLPSREELNFLLDKSHRSMVSTRPSLKPGVYTLAGLFTPNRPWSFRERSGVLEVKDELAFIDHLDDYPLPAILQLERSWDPKLAYQVHDLGYDLEGFRVADLVKFTKSVSPPQSAQLEGGYRGIEMPALRIGFPVLLALESVPQQQLANLATTTSKPAAVDFPVSPSTTQAVIASLQADPNYIPFSLRPNFAEFVSTTALRIVPRTAGDGTVSFDVDFCLPDPAVADISALRYAPNLGALNFQPSQFKSASGMTDTTMATSQK